MVEVDIGSIMAGIITGVVSGVSVFVIQRYISNRKISEKDMFWKWNRDFDRPAFYGAFTWYSDQEMYSGTIDDLIRAINTGNIARGIDAPLGYGRSFIKNKDRRQQMGDVVQKLTKIKSTISQAENKIDEILQIYYTETEDKKQELRDEMDKIKEDSKVIVDAERQEILDILNNIWRKMGIPTIDSKIVSSSNH